MHLRQVAIMHISLTPELESRIKAKVETGLYNNGSEVIREALRFMETHEDWINEIKLDQGKGIAIESSSALDTLFDEIKR